MALQRFIRRLYKGIKTILEYAFRIKLFFLIGGAEDGGDLFDLFEGGGYFV